MSVADSVDGLDDEYDIATTSTPTPTPTPTPSTELSPRPEALTALDEPRAGQSNIAVPRKASSKRKSENDELLEIERKRLLSSTPTPSEDQSDTFGKLMAHKIRNLPHQQRIIAEKLCHEIMFDAELGNLTPQTKIIHRIAEYSTQTPEHAQSEVYRCYNYNSNSSNYY